MKRQQTKQPAPASTTHAPEESRGAATPRRHVAQRLKAGAPTYEVGAIPIKEGMVAGETVNADRTRLAQQRAVIGDDAETGQRAAWLLVRGDNRETPVFEVEDVGDAIAVFTSRELAVLYLQVARWDEYRVQDLAPTPLAEFLEAIRGEVQGVLVDPNFRAQERERGRQPCVRLEGVGDFSGENVFREILAHARSR